MARVMRDATVQALATKLFYACGSHCDSYVSDTSDYWTGVVKAWSVGSTRPLQDEDMRTIVVWIQSIEEAREEQLKYAAEDEEA